MTETSALLKVRRKKGVHPPSVKKIKQLNKDIIWSHLLSIVAEPDLKENEAANSINEIMPLSKVQG